MTFAIGILLLGIVSGCSVDHPAAVELAKRGEQAATAGADSLQGLSDRLNTMLGERMVENGLLTKDLSDPALKQADDDITAKTDKIRGALAARKQMLSDLATLYESFGTLVGLDAKTSSSTAAGNLVDSINQFATATKQSPPIDATAGNVIKDLAAGAAQAYQDQKIKNASQAIRLALKPIAELLEKEGETYKVLDDVASETSSQLAADLFNQGVGRPHSILKRIVEANGLEYDEKAVNAILDAKPGDPIRPARDTISRGIVAYLQGQSALASTRRKAVTKATVSALRKLEEEHVKLEAGKPVDLAAVTDALNKLKTTIESLKTAK